MADKNAEKKRIEAYVLTEARKAGMPIPIAEIPGERPDFRFNTKPAMLGIEVSELLRPASSNDGIPPVAEESFHRELVQMAQEAYFGIPDAKPVHVSIYFANARGKKRNKWQMSRELLQFVRSKAHLATPFVVSYNVPEGFSSIVVSSATEANDWWCGECGGYTLDDIRLQLTARIADKNKLVSAYRANMPKGAHVWLLLYSLVTVSRSMSIPHGIEEWKFPFDFERVFWFTCLEGQFVEIQRA